MWGVYHNIWAFFFNMKPFSKGIHCYEQKILHSMLQKQQIFKKKKKSFKKIIKNKKYGCGRVDGHFLIFESLRMVLFYVISFTK